VDRKYTCIKGHNSETVRVVLIIWFNFRFSFYQNY